MNTNHCLNKDNLENLIQTWVKNNVNLVSVKHPVSIHIDELLERPMDSMEAVKVALLAFEYFVKQIHAMGNPIKSILTISLFSISKKIGLAVPYDLDNLIKQLDITPPELYMLDWELSKVTAPCEEFNAPLPFKLADWSIEDIYVYYREYRYAMAIENDWEVWRAIYVEYYPKGIIIQ